MAGDCPHSTVLETSMQQCHIVSPLRANTHESYLKIIEDLKNDLEQISSEVIMVQKECSDQNHDPETDDVGLENSLRELETQNDRLEQALKLHTQKKEADLMEVQTNNEYLKCQIVDLQQMVIEKEEYINLLHNRLSCKHPTDHHPAALEYVTNVGNNFKADLERKINTLSEKLDKSRKQEQFLTRETRKLNEELNESKRKNVDLIAQAHRVSALLQSQQNNSKELAAKYEAMQDNYEDQTKKLRAANNQLYMLDDRLQAMEKRQMEYNTERNFLREEVLSLKEKHACSIGRQKSIQEQLLKTEKELYTAHDVIKEQKGIMQRNEHLHIEAQRRLQETNTEMKRKFEDLVKEYQKLQNENENLKETNTQQQKVIDSFYKWKKEQLKREQATREGFKMYEMYIAVMLEDKKKLLNDFHDLSKEYSLLQNECERLQVCPLSISHINNSLNTTPERSIINRLKILHDTTRRISRQNITFKDEEPIASQRDSSPTYKPSEEPL